MYGPQRGFAQSQYFDQQATAIPGLLAYASDINLVDSAFVGAVDPIYGLLAGTGIMINPTTVSNRPGINYDVAVPPTVTATDADFAGVVVRNQWMDTNPNGDACIYPDRMCNYARRGRAGSRIWVRLEAGTSTFGAPVYWIVRDTAGTGKTIGSFSAEPITGTATPTPAVITGGTLVINSVKAVTNGSFDITVGGTAYKLAATDFSGVTTLSAIATTLQTALTAASAPVTVSVHGNGLRLTTTATGASATIALPVAPTTADTTDVSGVLGLTAASGALVTQGSAGEASDTVELSNVRFLDTFATQAQYQCNNMALIELL